MGMLAAGCPNVQEITMPNLPDVGDLIDGRYKVTDICSNDGGMGILYFVDDKNSKVKKTTKLVLKYCKAVDDPSIRRFRREIRLLNSFRGNGKVAQLHDLNAKHDPPYYVMKLLCRWRPNKTHRTAKDQQREARADISSNVSLHW